MKKAVVILLVLTLMITAFSINAFASYDAELKVKYERLSNDDLLVTASIINIKVEGGIYTIGYEINYNPAALELTSAYVNIPDKWQPLVGDPEGPDNELSMPIKDGKYFWCSIIFKEGYGIIEDDQLYITLQFKPLVEGESNIEFVCTDIYGYDLDIVNYKSSNAKITVNSSNDMVIDESQNNQNNNSQNDNTVDDTSNIIVPDNGTNSENDVSADNSISNGNNSSDNVGNASDNTSKEESITATNDEATIDNLVTISPTHKTIGIIATVIMGMLIFAGIVYFIIKRKEILLLVKENSGVIVKFWLTHIVMSILGIMVGLALLVLEGEAEGISLIAIIGSAFTIGFMCFMHYDDMYFFAVKEGIKDRAEGKTTDILKGLKLTLISYAPVIIIGFITIIFTTFASEIENTSVVPMLLYYIFQGSFLGLYKIHTYLGVAAYVIITLLPAIVAGALAYVLGVKDKTLRGVLGMDVKPPYDGPVEKKNNKYNK